MFSGSKYFKGNYNFLLASNKYRSRETNLECVLQLLVYCENQRDKRENIYSDIKVKEEI